MIHSAVRQRRVLVTGGTRGIGAGIAARFAEAGYRVAVSGRSERSASSGAPRVFAADLRDEAAASRLVADVVADLGGIDALVHCAGIYPEAPLGEMTSQQWREVLDVNLTSAFLLTQAALPVLSRSDAGRIVLISSITGPRTALPGLAHYAASKGGVEGFARAAAREAGAHGITVNAIAPGTVLTEGLEQLYTVQEREELARRVPVGRLGTPADIGALAVWLSSPEAGFVTGQSIIVDGGQTIVE